MIDLQVKLRIDNILIDLLALISWYGPLATPPEVH